MNIFSKPKPPTMPKVTPAFSPPRQLGDSAGDEAMRQAKRRSGFSKTILAGDLEPMVTGKKTLLGG